MGKLSKQKSFEKKAKSAIEFDKKTPEQRVKTIKAGKVTKKGNEIKKNVLKAAALETVKDPETKISKVQKEKVTKDVNLPVVDLKELISLDIVKAGITNLRKGVKKEVETNTKIAKNLFDDELRFGLNVIGVKIPDGPPHTRKM